MPVLINAFKMCVSICIASPKWVAIFEIKLRNKLYFSINYLLWNYSLGIDEQYAGGVGRGLFGTGAKIGSSFYQLIFLLHTHLEFSNGIHCTPLNLNRDDRGCIYAYLCQIFVYAYTKLFSLLLLYCMLSISFFFHFFKKVM